MKTMLITILVLVMSVICFSETLTITKTPETLPRTFYLGQFSPMMEFTYGGLTQQQYILKVWLLNRGPWYCASTQWCESRYIIDNTDGTNSNGKLQIVKNMDVYSYSNLDWVARLYKNGSQVAWDEYYLNGVSNRPPVLASIGNQNCCVGETISFTANASDLEGDSIIYSISNLPSGASFDSSGNFNWLPSAEGEHKVFVHADDGQTYDSEEITISIGSVPDLELQDVFIPPCGTTQNVTGKVTGTDNMENYRVICYIFVSGYGWVTKPYAAYPMTPINTDGTFEVDITTGGIDTLADIVYLGVCHMDADIPIISGSAELPANLPVYVSQKFRRDPTACHEVIEWSGYTWYIKDSQGGAIGPGPNIFSDSEQNVFVDSNGYLHLKIIYDDGNWKCSEIVSIDTFGYGIYEFDIASGPLLDQSAVLGMFTWEDDVEYNREVDIEFSRWNDPERKNGQYVIQPWQNEGNIFKFEMPETELESRHRFFWKNDQIIFQSSFISDYWQTADSIVADWIYERDYIPFTGNENVRLNLWIVDGGPPFSGEEQEVVIKQFRFLCSENLPGDINRDCTVNMLDFIILASNWLE